MPRTASGWVLTKGTDRWRIVDQLRVTPAPKLGGWAGKHLRLLSVTRGQSVLTDIEHGSLAVKHRRAGLPTMQRMWFHGQGPTLGYTKPRGSPDPAELFFFDSEARLVKQQFVPAAIADAGAGTNEWFAACRNGRVYAFSLDGAPLWNELIPYARRDNSINESCGLPVFHPTLRLATETGVLAVGAHQELHGYHNSGLRLWSTTVPTDERSDVCEISTELPLRDERLARLQRAGMEDHGKAKTAYVRLAFDGGQHGGWATQVEVSDIRGNDEIDPLTGRVVQIAAGLPFIPGISVLRAYLNGVVVGTQDGLIHVFDRDGRLRRTFHIGSTSVSELLVSAEGLIAAYCAGRLTLFEPGRMTAVVELPEYFGALTCCGAGVLVWKLNSLWVVEPSGRVQLAAEAERPIQGVWGFDTGFYVLARDVSMFQAIPATSP